MVNNIGRISWMMYDHEDNDCPSHNYEELGIWISGHLRGDGKRKGAGVCTVLRVAC